MVAVSASPLSGKLRGTSQSPGDGRGCMGTSVMTTPFTLLVPRFVQGVPLDRVGLGLSSGRSNFSAEGTALCQPRVKRRE